MTTLSKAAMARALELASQRVGREKIAKALTAEGLADVSGRTVGRAIKAAEVAGHKVPQPRTGRRRKRPKRERGGAAAAPPPIPEAPPVPDLGDLADKLEQLDIPAELTVVRATWLPKMRQVADQAIREEEAGVARDWIRLYVETAERLLAAIPPPPPDPEDDPAYATAQKRVRQIIARLVRRHEAGT